MTTQNARITGPICYKAANGRPHNIPLGPCLIEQLDDRSIDIIWGAYGQRSAELPLAEIESARQQGNLVMLE